MNPPYYNTLHAYKTPSSLKSFLLNRIPSKLHKTTENSCNRGTRPQGFQKMEHGRTNTTSDEKTQYLGDTMDSPPAYAVSSHTHANLYHGQESTQVRQESTQIEVRSNPTPWYGLFYLTSYVSTPGILARRDQKAMQH